VQGVSNNSDAAVDVGDDLDLTFLYPVGTGSR